MKKIFKRLKNRAGLTLTEMLVTVLILTIFSSAVLTGMTTALSVRRDNIMANDAEIIASMTVTYITNELRTASDIKVEGDSVTYQSNESGFKNVTLKLDGGQLVMVVKDGNAAEGADDKGEIHVFSDAAYSDNSVKKLSIQDLNFEQKGESVKVTFGVGYDDGGKTVKIATADTEFNVGLMNGVKDEDEGDGEPDPTLPGA